MKQLRWTTLNRFFAAFVCACLVSCSLGGPLREDQKASSYKIETSVPGWRELKDKADADHAWLDAKTGAVMSVRSLCDRYEHVSIRNLSKNLQTVLTDAEVISSQDRTIASREAQDTLVKGELDGVPVESRLVVVRKNNCIFDFTVTEHPKISASTKQSMEVLLNSFDYQGEASQ